MIFYIRWNNSWFLQHAKEEFNLQWLDLDIDRASWLVELVMEFRDDKSGEFPPSLIEKLSTGLFDPSVSDGGHDASTNTDLLSLLLGSSSNLDMQVQGNSLKFDRKGLKNLNKGLAE